MTFEMNNVRKDSNITFDKLNQASPVVEIFSAMAKGESLDKFGKKADVAVDYIKGLGAKADCGDPMAKAELNSIRRFVLERPVMEEIKLLSLFGSYTNVGWDETVEREVIKDAGDYSRLQAEAGDVTFPALTREVYAVPMFTVSGGYAVDYRRVANGDMTAENQLLEHVKTDILNKAKAEVIKRIYNAVKNATGVKYTAELAGLTKAGVDGVINKVRRNGRPSIFGDYAALSQFTPWAGYAGTVSSKDILGISDAIINEIAANGLLANYNGCTMVELANPYNRYELNASGDNFKTLLPEGLVFVIPAGVNSPIATYSQGGLTSMTGNDVKTGKELSRFDIRIGCDCAKGFEDRVGVLLDTNLSTL